MKDGGTADELVIAGIDPRGSSAPSNRQRHQSNVVYAMSCGDTACCMVRHTRVMHRFDPSLHAEPFIPHTLTTAGG